MRLLANEWLKSMSSWLAGRCGIPQSVSLRSCLRRTSRRWLRALGKPGVLAIGVLVVFPPFYFSAVVPAQARLDEARRSTLALSELNLHGGKLSRGARGTPGQQLAEFYMMFPEERYSPQWLERLIELAERNGLSLNEGEYKTSRDKVGRLMRLQMTLPVKGEYPQIRSFLAALPTEIPVAALEGVQFSRQSVADPAVEARIRLAIFLEREL